jgi:hypothetical protein
MSRRGAAIARGSIVQGANGLIYLLALDVGMVYAMDQMLLHI